MNSGAKPSPLHPNGTDLNPYFLPNYYSGIYFLITPLELILGGLDKGKKIQLTYDGFLASSDM